MVSLLFPYGVPPVASVWLEMDGAMLTRCQEIVADLRSDALDAEVIVQSCGYHLEQTLPRMEKQHPVATVLLLMGFNLLAAAKSAEAAARLAEAGAIQQAEAIANGAAAMEEAAKLHGINW